MKNKGSILVGLCLIALSTSVWGQNLNLPSVSGIPGYLDPATGTFRLMPSLPESDDVTPVTPTTGKFVVNLTVTLTTTFGTGETYSCGVTALALDVTTGLSFLDSYQITATKSGTTLTCNMTLPYSWALTSPATDKAMVSYSVNAVNGTSGLPTRLAQHGVANIKVPANGTTTTFTLSTAI